jgi:serine protease AprX
VKNLVKKCTSTGRLSLGLVTLAATLSGLAPASAASLPSLKGEGSNAKSVIVHVKPGQLADVTEALVKRGARIDRSLTAIDSLVITIASDAQPSVAAISGVDSVVDDLILQPSVPAPQASVAAPSAPASAPAPSISVLIRTSSSVPPITAPAPVSSPTSTAAPAVVAVAPAITPTTAVVALTPNATVGVASVPSTTLDVAAQKAVADKAIADKVAAEKVAADKVAADKAAAEKVAADKIAAEKEAADKAATEKALADQSAAKLKADKDEADKTAADKIAVDKAAKLKALEGKSAEDKAKADKDQAEKSAAKTSEEKAKREKSAADKAKADKDKSDKADKDKSDKDKADKDKSDKDKADKDKADKDKAEKDKADKEKGDKESTDAGSLESIARVTGARDLWKKGFTGKGVDIALIDSGIAPVPGAPTIVNGADLSLDAGKANLRFLDGYGHGTHMAGIIAGKDASVTQPEKAKGAFVGIAPGSRVVNVKVGAMDGTVHTSQVIAGIDWIIQNRSANGMNIRVVNLSYGSPATSNWKLDPLAWAAEVAWNRGILVVAAAGNEGAGHELASPAYSPRILAVGATEVESARGGRRDYAVASFTSSGTRRRPDLYVPGAHVASLRVKNSFVDTFLAKANVSDQLTRASGTSQAAAVTSGLAALLFEAFPQANAEQIKALLTGASDKEHGRKDAVTGIETSLDLGDAYKQGLRRLPAVAPIDPLAECGPTICRGIGDGSAPFVNWAQASWNGVTWLMNQWSANQWSANQWSGNQWSANQWSANQWSANQWSANQWSGNQWSANQWSANQWSANQWSSSQWSANQWSANQWSSSQWSSSQWSSNQWSSSQWSGEAWLSAWGQ